MSLRACLYRDAACGSVFIHKEVVFATKVFQIAPEAVACHEHALAEHQVAAACGIGLTQRRHAQHGILMAKTAEHPEASGFGRIIAVAEHHVNAVAAP